MTIFVNRSNVTKIPVYSVSVDSARLVTQSILFPSQGLYSGGSGKSTPYCAWRSAWIWSHSSQPATYFRTGVSSSRQLMSPDTSSAVLRALK